MSVKNKEFENVRLTKSPYSTYSEILDKVEDGVFKVSEGSFIIETGISNFLDDDSAEILLYATDKEFKEWNKERSDLNVSNGEVVVSASFYIDRQSNMELLRQSEEIETLELTKMKEEIEGDNYDDVFEKKEVSSLDGVSEDETVMYSESYFNINGEKIKVITSLGTFTFKDTSPSKVIEAISELKSSM